MLHSMAVPLFVCFWEKLGTNSFGGKQMIETLFNEVPARAVDLNCCKVCGQTLESLSDLNYMLVV